MVQKSALHLVWDWNGTVLNDFDVSFRSTNSSFRDAGLPEITTVAYRALLRSPIRSFYAAVLGRAPSDEECDVLDQAFHAYCLLCQKEAAPSPGLPHLFPPVAWRRTHTVAAVAGPGRRAARAGVVLRARPGATPP